MDRVEVPVRRGLISKRYVSISQQIETGVLNPFRSGDDRGNVFGQPCRYLLGKDRRRPRIEEELGDPESALWPSELLVGFDRGGRATHPHVAAVRRADAIRISSKLIARRRLAKIAGDLIHSFPLSGLPGRIRGQIDSRVWHAIIVVSIGSATHLGFLEFTAPTARLAWRDRRGICCGVPRWRGFARAYLSKVRNGPCGLTTRPRNKKPGSMHDGLVMETGYPVTGSSDRPADGRCRLSPRFEGLRSIRDIDYGRLASCTPAMFPSVVSVQ